MFGKSTWIGLLLVSVMSCIAGESGFDPQPYTPVKNSPAQSAAKRAALDAFRVQVANNHWDWHQLGYNEATILPVFKAHKMKDLSAVVDHFNPKTGAWHKSLTMPDPIDFSNKKIYKPLYEPHEEYLIEVLALAYLSKYEGKDYKDLVFKTLSWYFNEGFAPPHQYNLTFTYGSGAGRTNFSKVLLMIGHTFYDEIHAERVTDPVVEKLFQNIREYCRVVISAGPQIRGANWNLRMDHCLNYILFTDEIYDMDQYDYHYKESVSFNRWQEGGGVFPDGSMTHHGDIPYWGKYGQTIVERNILYGEVFKGTPWAYTKEKLDFIAYYMLEARRWSYYRGVEDFTISGDQSIIKGGKLDTSEWQKEMCERLLAMGAGQFDKEEDLRKEISNYDAPFWTVSDKDGMKPTSRQDKLSGHRYLWTTDYQVHRRPNYSISVKRNSQRSRSPESRPGANCTLHLSSGFTPILRKGDEAYLSRLSWDYLHLPGTTVEQGLDIGGGGSASPIRGLNLFSGGVTDGQYGFGAFEMNLVQFTKDNLEDFKYINGAGALKGTFFFDEGMVALGQKINRIATVEVKTKGKAQAVATANEILTTINNVRRVSEVVYSINRKKEVTVPLTKTVNEESHSLADVSWVYHDGIGYVIWPSASASTKLVLSFKEIAFNSEIKNDYKNRLKDVLGKDLGAKTWDNGNGVQNMFRLWLDHGVDPKDDTYVYAVLPDCTLAELKAYAAKPPVQIVANAHGIQAVKHSNSGLYYASFANEGMVDFGEGRAMKTDRPLMVMARKGAKGDFTFHASNPLHCGLRASFIPGEGKTVGTLIEQPVQIRAKGFGIANSIQFQFSTERGEEGRSVQGVVKKGAVKQ